MNVVEQKVKELAPDYELNSWQETNINGLIESSAADLAAERLPDLLEDIKGDFLKGLPPFMSFITRDDIENKHAMEIVTFRTAAKGYASSDKEWAVKDMSAVSAMEIMENALESTIVDEFEFIPEVYKLILDRYPDLEGEVHYQERLDNGEYYYEIIRDIELSPEAMSKRNDQ